MKNKKIIIIFTAALIIVLVGGFFAIKYLKQKQEKETTTIEEYTPQEEISEEQLRQTIVSLYFISKETKELEPEARLIDIKEIINDPCDKLINLLIEGPKNEKLKKLIPDNTTILKTYTQGDCLYIDFSSDILGVEEGQKDNMINSITKTMTELTEINSVKILVDGQEGTI